MVFEAVSKESMGNSMIYETIFCNVLLLTIASAFYVYVAVLGSFYSGYYSDEYPEEVYCPNGVAFWLFVLGIFLAIDLGNIHLLQISFSV